MRFLKDRRRLAALLAALSLMLLPFYLSGCGSDYDDPQAEVGSVMVSTAMVNSWVMNGYGTDDRGYSKMVVLDVNTAGGYISPGHVPGAYLVDEAVDVSATRSDGVADTISQVATKAQMDDVIRRTGIDENTVVLITGRHMMFIGRAYFNFRYWGFPRERLRVMNGTNARYAADGFSLVISAPPAPEPSTYSVCNLEQNTSVRASMAEMIQVARDNDPKTVVVDARSPNEYNGVAGSTGGSASGTKVAFEGHIRTAVLQNYTGLLATGNAATDPLIPRANLIAAMNGIGVNVDTVSYSYCRTSWRAAVTFLALDAELGWPTKIYDGAWIEWGQMADNDPTYDGALDPASQWRTDTSAASAAITYNKPAGFTVDDLAASSFALRADLINLGDSTVCGGGGGGGGGGGPAPGY